jgi:hypothetical protein
VKRIGVFLLGGLGLAIALAMLSPFASKNPDGLEHVSKEHNIAIVESAKIAAPIPDYWEDEGPLKKVAAGVIGTLLVFVLMVGLGKALRRRNGSADS